MQKIMFVASTGGHLNELMQIKDIFSKYDFRIMTEKTKSTKYLKDEYPGKVNYFIYGTKDHLLTYIPKIIYNFIFAFIIYLRYHPNYIVTTGAHVGGIMALIGKIFGSKIIYIETFANINTKTVTGKLVYNFADYFIVQWEDMKKIYPEAIVGGWIF